MRTDLFYYSYLYLLQATKEKLSPAFRAIDDQFLQNLCMVLDNNIDNTLLSVGFLAMQMAVSKSTLNRRLSSITGLSANELIKRYRLRRAAILLMSGKNVSQAAYLTGFETPSYFTQCFKELYKITPREYARIHTLNYMVRQAI